MSKLILIGLPIGNIQDLTQRAREALKGKNCFFVEDTRAFCSLMAHLGLTLDNKMVDSFHDQSDSRKMSRIMELLESGQEVCLASEAGSPIISDPAYPVVREAILRGIEVESLPGVSSVTTALELSGLPPQPFHFHGFIPRDGKLDFIGKIKGTHIFFESPKRLLKSLGILAELYPYSDVVVARELTKLHQSLYRFKACQFQEESINFKGECVVMIHLQEANLGASELLPLAQECLDKKGHTKSVAKLLAKITGMGSKEIYAILTN